VPEPPRIVTLPTRKAVKVALRAAGLSDRQVRALLHLGWSGLVGEAKAEAEELRSELDEMLTKLQPKG
jgi:hypothetical protein